MIKLKPFRQTPGFCGPASLKMIFDYYGISIGESALAKLCGATKEKGVSVDGLVKAAKSFGFKTFVKKNSSLADIEYFVKRNVPVIVDWFLKDDGHYSVVVDINKRNIILMDPTLRKVLIYIRRRKLLLEDFYRTWFDFPGNYIKKPSDLVLRLMFVAIPKEIVKNVSLRR